jgi:hypothetical protein
VTPEKEDPEDNYFVNYYKRSFNKLLNTSPSVMRLGQSSSLHVKSSSKLKYPSHMYDEVRYVIEDPIPPSPHV